MDDKPKEDKKEEKTPIKSWDQLRKESRQQAREKYAKKLGLETKDETVKPKSEDTPPAEQPKVEGESRKEEVKETPKEEEPKIDVGAVAKKAAEEAATRVAESTKIEFQSKIDEILNKDKDIQDKQKEADALIASWDKEKRLPKDYKELIDETMRIAEVKFGQQHREAERARVEAEKTKTPDKPAEAPKDEGQEKLESFQKEITSDLEDIYTAGFMKKPSSLDEINNENTADEAAKETQKLLAFGVKLNTDRVKAGQPPITSLNKIFFLHYKPVMDKAAPKNSQPAGADAPISPSRTQANPESNTPRPFYSKGEDGKYHAKTWAQIKYEQMKARLSK